MYARLVHAIAIRTRTKSRATTYADVCRFLFPCRLCSLAQTTRVVVYTLGGLLEGVGVDGIDHDGFDHVSCTVVQVLSDPQKRELYDQLGETGMLMMEDPFAAKDVRPMAA